MLFTCLRLRYVAPGSWVHILPLELWDTFSWITFVSKNLKIVTWTNMVFWIINKIKKKWYYEKCSPIISDDSDSSFCKLTDWILIWKVSIGCLVRYHDCHSCRIVSATRQNPMMFMVQDLGYHSKQHNFNNMQFVTFDKVKLVCWTAWLSCRGIHTFEWPKNTAVTLQNFTSHDRPL